MNVLPIAARITGRGWPLAADPGQSLRLEPQRGKEVSDARGYAAPEIQFDLALDVVCDEAGEIRDWRGPIVHGPRGARFLYLCWGQVGDDGTFAMSSRAKLPLPTLAGPAVGRLCAGAATLVGTLDLADPQGRPISGSVRPPRLSWSID